MPALPVRATRRERPARLRVSTDAEALAIQIFQAGPELKPTQGNDTMNGVPVTAPQTIDWTENRSAPHTISIGIGDWPSGLYYARLTTSDGRVGFAPYVVRPGTLGVIPSPLCCPRIPGRPTTSRTRTETAGATPGT